MHKVERSCWSYMLAPQLIGRAQKVFAAMETKQLGNYNALKDDILTRCNINEEAYCQRFRGFSKKGEETYRELVTE